MQSVNQLVLSERVDGLTEDLVADSSVVSKASDGVCDICVPVWQYLEIRTVPHTTKGKTRE
jgi:hypothetical protein